MIQVPTVLVLGAGASVPYGFPSGAELRRLIISSLKPRLPRGQLSTLLIASGFSVEEINDFRTELMNSNTTSVDLFLEKRRKFINIGKAAIAASLLPFEADSKTTMLEPWECALPLRDRAKEGWYQYFASQLKLGYDNWGRGLLTILSYNYDRSFEHYLFTILRSSCDRSLDECWKKFQEIPIIHLHGALGRYHPGNSDALEYGVPLDPKTTLRAAAEIKIIHEVQPGGEFNVAQEALDDAHVVCFLGCGYAPENMMRLDWDQRKKPDHSKILSGTRYNITDAEARRLRLGQYFMELPSRDWTVLTFLKETNVLG
jgi:hypothetical protein